MKPETFSSPLNSSIFSLIPFSILGVVCSLKVVTLIIITSSSILTLAAVNFIMSLMITISKGSSSKFLTIVSDTSEPTGPLILSTASDKERPRIASPST